MSKIKVGNAPCSWGTLEFEEIKDNGPEYASVLHELSEAGYSGSELGDWGFMPTKPDDLAREFRERDLALTGAFVPIDLSKQEAHREGLRRSLQTARLLKETYDQLETDTTPYLVLADDNGTDPVRTAFAGRVLPTMGLTESEWTNFTVGANLIAQEVLDETGLRTVFHHHCGGYVETPDEISRFLNRTSSLYLGLVFDTGHYAFGAGGCDDIIAALDRYADRIWYVHFKDLDAQVLKQAISQEWNYFKSVENGIFCELGQGCVDFSAVLRWLEEHDYDGYVTVEQDVLPGMGTPFESAKRNRKFLKSIGL